MSQTTTAAAVATLVSAARSSRAVEPDGVCLIGLDGRSGSGKSTIARSVGVELKAPVVAIEDVYPGWDGLRAGIERITEWVVEPLATGRPAGLRRWDWASASYGGWVPVAPAPFVVVEGVGAGSLLSAPFLSLLAYLDRPPSVRYARAIARDGEVFAPFWDMWTEQEDDYLRTDRPDERADVFLSLTG